MKKLILASGLLLLLTVTACQSKHKQGSGNLEHKTLTDSSIVKIIPEYAQGFKITYTDQACLLDIQDPQNKESQSFHYALVPRGVEAENIPADYTVIEIPFNTYLMNASFFQTIIYFLVKQMACTGDTHHCIQLFQLDKIGKLQGSHADNASYGNFDNEVIMSVNPDLILISPFKRGGYDALKEVGIPLMPHLGYKEMTPLGQAEWIKFVGLLLGKEDKANERFAAIKKRYNELKELTGRVTKRPVVFSGELRGGNWYAVGGRSFLAQLFKDAGADYFLKDDERSGGVTLDFETVYSQAAGADYWRIVNSYQGKFSYNTLKEEDARYVDFKAYKEKGVIYCNMREKPFYESMPTEPEVVLADLIQIFHPQLLSGHQPGYYELLK